MATPDPLRASFRDPRGGERALRVSWHLDDAAPAGAGADGAAGLAVLSLWRDNLCTASFRLPIAEVPELVAVLQAGLDAAAGRPDSAESAAAAAG